MISEHLMKQSLVDLAYEAIKKDIVTGKLSPGKKIIIRDLSERYGVSETPIKQALNRLVTDGLVETLLRKGMRVKELKWEEIKETLQMRLMIETFSVKPAISAVRNDAKIKQSFIDNILENKRIIEEAIDLNNYSQYSELERKHSMNFHYMFIACCENKKIMDLYRKLDTHSYTYYIYGVQKEERVIQSFHEHESLCKALIDQDEEELIKCVETHITNRAKDVRAIYEKLGEI